jgi:hypothetical protein
VSLSVDSTSFRAVESHADVCVVGGDEDTTGWLGWPPARGLVGALDPPDSNSTRTMMMTRTTTRTTARRIQ